MERKGQGVRGKERKGEEKGRKGQRKGKVGGRVKEDHYQGNRQEGKTGTKEGRKESVKRRKHSEKTVAANVLRAKRNRTQLPDHRHVLRQPRCRPAGAPPPRQAALPPGGRLRAETPLRTGKAHTDRATPLVGCGWQEHTDHQPGLKAG